MMFRSATVATTVFFLSWANAMAGPATPEGAERLLTVFQTYLGATDGVVSVAPEGDSYKVVVDFAPFVALAPQGSMGATVTPYEVTLTDQGGGLWNMTQDQAFSAEFTVPGSVEISYKIGSLKGQGVFDEKISAFSSSRYDMLDVAMTQVMTLPDQPPSTSSMQAAAGLYESSAVAATAGGVDGTFSYTMSGYSQVMGMPAADGMPPMDITVSANSYGGSGTTAALRPDAFYKLIAWFVAHPSEAAIKADQAGLKDVLREGLPFFQAISSTGGMEGVAIQTPVGTFEAEKIGVDVEMNGVVADGRFREAISVTGLTVPQGLLPEWSVGLIPNAFAIDVTASRFNLADPVAAIIEAFDLTKSEPVDPALTMSLVGALLPEGVVDISLAPGSVTASLFDLKYEGAMSAGPDAMPVGKAMVSMTGMDAVMAALQAAPPEVGGQIVPMLGMAQGMAKPGEDGALVWEIDASTPGTLLVNGVDMMTMMGGP